MKKPLLTVCLITYNQVKYVRQAIDTILDQKVNFSWELVIADDYSTDGTREIIQEYKERHPQRINLILQEKNVGPEENWLKLLSYPKSKYLIYTEGDDYFTDSAKLQKQVDYLETHKTVALCFHPTKVIYEDKSRPDEIFPSAEQRHNKNILDLKDLLRANFMETNSVMYRWRFSNGDIKEVFPKNLMPGDWFLHILHAEQGKIGLIDEVMSVYRRHAGGIWWLSYNNLSEFWAKYGLSHIAFQNELLSIYGDNKACRQIISNNLNEVFKTLIDQDIANNSELAKAAFLKYPDRGMEFIINQRLQPKALEAENKQLNHRIDKLIEEKKRTKELYTAKNAEVLQIYNSKGWKLLNKIYAAEEPFIKISHKLKKTK